jgi:hypothetical protein
LIWLIVMNTTCCVNTLIPGGVIVVGARGNELFLSDESVLLHVEALDIRLVSN